MYKQANLSSTSAALFNWRLFFLDILYRGTGQENVKRLGVGTFKIIPFRIQTVYCHEYNNIV